jgi:hypothetical protein
MPPKPRNRAMEIINDTINEYDFLKTELKPDQSINLVCYVGGAVFEVFSVSGYEYFMNIRTKDGNGDVHIITAAIEQIAFDIVITKKVNKEPPREIGFHVGFKNDKPSEKD